MALSAQVQALLELQALQHLPRTGWLQLGVEPAETIAAHSHGVALLVLALAPRCAPPLDLGRALALAVVHDAPEARLGDWPRAAAQLLPPGAKRAAELRAAEQMLAPLDALVLERLREAVEGATREARFMKLCDRLQLGLRLLGYARSGWRGLEELEQWLAAQDCSEFAPCADLQRELLAELAHVRARGGA